MNIIIRTDSSTPIGTGHLMRCLTLADELCQKSTQISFICRELPENLCDLVEEKGYPVHRLPYAKEQLKHAEQHTAHSHWLGVDWQTDVKQTKAVIIKEAQNIDWLIVDHYALDKQWEVQMRPHVKHIMVIDDLADRMHDCDLLLDQNLHLNMAERYQGLLPSHCRHLLGPRYALLRPEFTEVRKKLRKRDGKVKRILVFFGGCDPTNETTKAIQAIRLLGRPDIAIDVVVGSTNPHQEQVKKLCSETPSITFYCQVHNMAELMAAADLAIGAGGSTTWERCCLGLPAITLVTAQNQLETTTAVAEAGAIINLCWHSGVDVKKLHNAIEYAVKNPAMLESMSEKAMQVTGGKFVEHKNALLRNIIEK
ncbi:MAG: UDP-2,4-diacetamido-2,4,6-trideoxy-beta-L-altropyranose hydrolase [Desulfotomaculum sp.]|nr:UDP-2,4-diacetamido-2,4,6-trideoxy-beta-L-altropyranose hydrolase [Desulfotomaculum sp.]